MDKIAELLSGLAAKLGDTTLYLWGVLVRQAYLDGIVMLVEDVLIVILVFYVWKMTRYFTKAIEEGDRDETWWAVLFFVWVVTAIMVIMAFYSLPNIVAAFFNPEYWALTHVLGQITGCCIR